MLPYYLLVGIPALFCCFSKYVKQLSNKKNVGIVVFFLIFMVLLALRDVSCGKDLQNYSTIFHSAITSTKGLVDNIKEQSEPMYFLWEKAIGFFTTNFQFFISVTSLVCIIPIMIFYKKEAELPFLTMVLFLCLGTFVIYFSGLRQSIAMAFAIPAWYLAKKKKIVWFVIVVAIAALFHRSAILMFLIYPLYHVSITKKWLWAVVPSMVLVFVFNSQIFAVLGNLLEKYNDKYTASIDDTGAYSMLILFLAFVVFSYVIPDEEKLDKDTIAMRNILLLVAVLQCFAPLNSLAMRINYYFITFIPVLIPRIINRSSFRMFQVSKISILVLSVVFSLYFFYMGYFGGDQLQIFPYVPYWEGSNI